MRNLILPLFFAAALTASAQRFTFGVKAGVPATSALPYDYSPYSLVDTGRWTVGPTVELRLVGSLSFEFDALFRGYRQQTSWGSYIPAGTSGPEPVAISGSLRQDAKEWDFPMLLKYRFREGLIRPFVDAGFEAAHVSSDFTSSFSCLSASSDACSVSGLAPYLYSLSSYSSGVNRRGPAAGAGVEFKYGRLRIAPEVRYTKLTHPNVNEVTVLAGFTF